MATFTKKNCPHCGETYRSYQGIDNRIYGCPLLVCPHCNKPFWDSEIKEPALYGYKNSYETISSIKMLIGLILDACFTAFLIWGGVYTTVNKEDGSITLFLFGGLGLLVFIVFVVFYIQSKRHPEETIKAQQDGYDASIIRLKDTNYLVALANYDPLAKKLLNERMNGEAEHYAKRPEIITKKNLSSTKEEGLSKERKVVNGKTPRPASNKEILETIEKMKVLFDAGILSQEEFEAKKADLLKRL